MNQTVSRHPKDETMAAFIEGKLAPGEVARVADHLRECPDCRTVAGETARWERDRKAAQPRWKGTRWLAIAAILAGVVALSLPLLRQQQTGRGPVQILIDAAPREHRRIQARLSGFRWARPAVVRTGAPTPTRSPADLKLQGKAGEVLEETAQKGDARSLHAKGVAHVLIGETTEGIAALDRAANAANDARMWNDLAVARYLLATDADRTAMLPEALAAANRAIRVDPKLLEARFNLALILQEMGARAEARQAWEQYLALDPGSAWSTEARRYLRALQSPDSSSFEEELERTRTAFAAGNRAAVVDLVRGFPQESRLWGESLLLAEWAETEAAGDRLAADGQLAFLRAIGEALVRYSGEGLLHDAVDAIDRADAPARTALVGAHLLYRDARKSPRISEALPAFRRAEALFTAAGSPMAEWAACHAADAAFKAGNAAESSALLRQLRARVNLARHRALSAQIRWNLARDANASADWGTAAREATAGMATFLDLGERDHAGFLEGVAALAIERIGNSDLAWKHRVSSFRAMTNMDRRRAVLHSTVFALAASDRVEAAEAVHDVFIRHGHGKPELLAPALADRARLAQRTGDAAGAQRFLAEARANAKEIGDPAIRAMTDEQIELAAAVLQTATEPQAAIRSLDRTITFFTEHNGRRLLPDAYLQRARAHRAAGNAGAAIADYEAAATEIEKQHGTIGENDNLSFLNGAAELVEETIELHLSRGAVAEAFAMADRAHTAFARSAAPPNVSPGMALLEYAVLPRRIVIFCVTSSGITAEVVPVDRRMLGEQLASLAEKIRSHESPEAIRSASAELHGLLIAPVRERLTGIDELVIVPDRQLHGLPFALLYDQKGGRHLFEDFALRLAPSARNGRGDSNGALVPAFVISEPASAGAPPRLPHSRTEASEIAALYGATQITRHAATRASVIDALVRGSLVHYAGHANSDVAQSYGALLLTPTDRDDGLLGTSEIARLPLGPNRPLVVLAACGTFRGEKTHLAGMPSLARAFLTAGARAVVGTLWEVNDDVASQLFVRFHTHLDAGMAPARALREAQIEMLQSSDPQLSHPSTWSPVEVLTNL